MNPRPGIEVIICTYNGAPRLPALFAALSAQSLDAARWSVLLIDNASTDSTAADARRLWPRPDVELRVINEPTPGQMAARERGRAETSRALVCFCDDDNLLAPDYLETALALIENQPALGVLGGCGDAISDAPLPAWFPLAASGYAVGPQAAVEGEVPSSRAFVYGADMIVRTDAWRDLYARGFRSRLGGRTGAKLKSGDDNELCLALALLGWKIHYSPRLRFQHAIPSRRLVPGYCHDLYRSFGDAIPVLTAYRDFLLHRATPEKWRACAWLRSLENRTAALKQIFAPVPSGNVTAKSLAAAALAGRVAACRDTFSRHHLHTLYIL